MILKELKNFPIVFLQKLLFSRGWPKHFPNSKNRRKVKGRDGHGRVELLHLVGEKGGKREPFVRDSGDEESIEEEEGTYGVRRRFEKAWRGVVR